MRSDPIATTTTTAATTSGGLPLSRADVLSHLAYHAARWYAAQRLSREGPSPGERSRQRSTAEDHEFDIRRWEYALEQHDEMLRGQALDSLHEYALLLDGAREAAALSAELNARPAPTSPYHQRMRSAESATLGAHRSDLERARLAWLAHATPELLAEVNRK